MGKKILVPKFSPDHFAPENRSLFFWTFRSWVILAIAPCVTSSLNYQKYRLTCFCWKLKPTTSITLFLLPVWNSPFLFFLLVKGDKSLFSHGLLEPHKRQGGGGHCAMQGKMSRVTRISKICQFSMTLTGTSSVISGPMGVIISLKSQIFDQDLGILVFLKRWPP